MMKYCLHIFFFCLLVGCSKKQDSPDLPKDDTFFSGSIGRHFFDLKNEFREDKAIKTIQESPNYHFVFSYVFESESFPKEATTLNVNIHKPKEGESYLITAEVPLEGTSKSGITYIQSTWMDNEIQSKTYLPLGLLKPVQLVVNKIENNAFSNSKTITGEIKGFLFNKLNSQDSIEIKANFRTKTY